MICGGECECKWAVLLSGAALRCSFFFFSFLCVHSFTVRQSVSAIDHISAILLFIHNHGTAGAGDAVADADSDADADAGADSDSDGGVMHSTTSIY